MSSLPDGAVVEDVEIWLGPIKAQIVRTPKPNLPVTVILTIGDRLMADVTISVDDTNAVAKVTWIDDHGDTDAPAPDAYVAAFTSDNPSVLTIDASSGQITPVAEGVANVSDPIQDGSGNPIPLPNGQGNFSAGSVAVTVGPGMAVSVGVDVTG